MKTFKYGLFLFYNKMRQINIQFSNRVLYTLITMVFVVLLGLGVIALAPSIDTSKGYHESNQVSISVAGTEKTLQEAIDDKSLGGSIPSGAVMAFNLEGCPDGWTELISARDRTIIGSGSSYSRGATGGASTHTHTGPSHTHIGGSYALTTANLAAHTHSYTTLAGYGTPGYSYWTIPDGGSGAKPLSIATSSAGSGTAHSHGATSAGGTGATGSSSSLQPYIALLYCVKN